MGKRYIGVVILLGIWGLLAGQVTFALELEKIDFLEEVTVGIYPNEPMVYMEEGEAKGLLVDLMNEVARLEGWNVTYVNMTFTDGLRAIEGSQVDLLLGVGWSEKRNVRYNYNKEPLFVNWGQIYKQADMELEGFQDLSGLKIGAYAGDIYYIGENGLRRTLDQFGIAVEYVEFDNYDEIFKGIQSGTLDAGIVNRTFGMVHEKEFRVSKTPIQLSPVQLHVIAPGGEKDDLLEAVDHHIAQMKADEDSIYYDRITAWFDTPLEAQPPLYMWIVLSILLTLLVLALGVIQTTRRIVRHQTAELRELNETLEHKVEERTLELDATNQQLHSSLFSLEEKQSELEEMNAILTEQIGLLEQTQGQLIEAEKMASLGRMVASLAHEMNTPLGVCVTLSSNLDVDTADLQGALEEGKMTKKQLTEYLRDVKRMAGMFESNLQSIVELVSRFKMLSSDRVHYNERKIKLHEYLHMQMDALSPELKHTNHQYEIDCPEDLEIVLDPGALSQVVRNLTMNSLVHGFDETCKGQIRLQVEQRSDDVLLSYMDNGKGIRPGIRDRVFEPFFTTKRNAGGTGLGLSITRSMVTQSLDGEIWIDGSHKEGVKFDMKLPLRTDEPPMYQVWNEGEQAE